MKVKEGEGKEQANMATYLELNFKARKKYFCLKKKKLIEQLHEARNGNNLFATFYFFMPTCILAWGYL